MASAVPHNSIKSSTTNQATGHGNGGTISSESSETTIRKLSPELTIFSRPFLRIGAHVGVRMTAIKLRNGGVLVYNPTELDDLTKSTLASIGPVQYIVAPSLVHHLWVDPYKKAFPDARVIGPEGLAAKHPTISFYRELKSPLEPLGVDDPSLDHVYLPDLQNQEILLFHKPSKTMLCADMIWNLPANEQYSHSHHPKSGFLTKMAESGMKPSAGVHHMVSYTMVKKTPALIEGLTKVLHEWEPSVIVPEHGDVITQDAVGRIKDAMSWAFKGGDPAGKSSAHTGGA